MRVLVVGSGGREHALVRALAGDATVAEVHAAPGNPGIAEQADVHQVPAVDDVPVVVELARRVGAGLVVVGPEAPLVAGLADALADAGIPCFGPRADAAALEGSKAFAKDVMTAADVPTAAAYTCEDAGAVEKALDAFGPPYVVKHDGLAGGKGVVVTHDRAAALAHAGGASRVVVEEYLDGPELSLFAVTDGTSVVPLLPAQDFKRAYDGDEGPNTGGMGAYSPLPWAPEGLVDEVVERVVQPTVDEMRRRGTPFAGLLYAGLAATSKGVRVVEFNCRLGDPDGQVVLARLRSPLAPLLHAAATGDLAAAEPLDWSDDAAVTVVVASESYPASPVTGDPVEGLADAAGVPGAYVLHAGTRSDGDTLVTAGGRVLDVVATAPTLDAARRAAYDAVGRIHIRGSHHRKDIAADAIAEDHGRAR